MRLLLESALRLNRQFGSHDFRCFFRGKFFPEAVEIAGAVDDDGWNSLLAMGKESCVCVCMWCGVVCGTRDCFGKGFALDAIR